MLLEFRVRNYRSYSSEKRFSMVAGSGKELPGNTMMVDGFDRYPLVRCAAIYGANASGKSNLVSALGFFRSFVLRSSETRREGEPIPVQPFLLDPELSTKPSEFEITFLFQGVRHQYGFVVSTERVHEEWLTVYPKGKPQEWFHRTLDETGKPAWSWSRTHLKGDKLQLAERTRDDALFLSVAAQWNHPQLKPIREWFANQFKVVPKDFRATNFTHEHILENLESLEWLRKILRAADIGISQILVTVKESEDLPYPIEKFHVLKFPHYGSSIDKKPSMTPRTLSRPKIVVHTTRRLAGSDKEIEWGLEQESDGTQRMFKLLGPIYDVLRDGSVLVMDELDTSLHADITRELVQLFNSPETNPNHAQLIFTTHDTSLLDSTLFRRDQIWFTSKDASGATDLYSLQDFSPRKGEAFQKGYLAGRYGATPVLKRFEFTPSNASGARGTGE